MGTETVNCAGQQDWAGGMGGESSFGIIRGT